MGLDDDIAILAAAPLFGFFDRDALRLLTFAGERRELAEGETLFRRGDATDGGYVVLSGAIALAPPVPDASPVIAGRSALIGRNALFRVGTRPSDAAATSASEVMRIAPALMARVLREFPAAAGAIHAALAEDLDELSRGLAAVGAKIRPRPSSP